MFDSVNNFLESNASLNYISADALLELLGCAVDDVFEQNNARSITEINVEEPTDFLNSLHAIMFVLVDLFDANQKHLTGFNAEKVKKFRELEQKSDNIKNELGAAKSDIDRLSKENSDLAAEQNKLEKSRGRLLGLEEENEKLRSRIAVLSDTKLDDARTENERLHTNLKQRIARVDELRIEKGSIQNQLNEIEKTIADLELERTELNRQYEENEKSKADKEREIAERKTTIDKFREWENGLRERLRLFEKEHADIVSRMQVCENVWKAVIKQDFPRSALFSENPISDVKKYSDVDKRFDEMLSAIRNGLNVFQEELREVIKASENLTKSQK